MSLSVSHRATTPPYDDLLRQLRAGEQQPLEMLYETLRTPFVHWAVRRYPRLNEEILRDAFQDAIIAFYENVVSGRIKELTVQPKTYVFRLGARFCKESERKLRLAIKISTFSSIKEKVDELMLPTLPADIDAMLSENPFGLEEDWATPDSMSGKVARALRQLTADCQRLLVTFYYSDQDISIKELSEQMGHNSVATTSVRKSQCMSRLRSILLASK